MEWIMDILVRNIEIDSFWFRVIEFPMRMIVFLLETLADIMDPSQGWNPSRWVVELPKGSCKASISELCKEVDFKVWREIGQSRMEAIELFEFYCRYGPCFVWNESGNEVHSMDADMELLFPLDRSFEESTAERIVQDDPQNRPLR